MDTGNSPQRSSVKESEQFVRWLDETGDVELDGLSLHASQADVKHHLEQGIMNAIELQSPSEYRRWTVAYVRFLISRATRCHTVTEDAETKLRKICLDLLQGRNGEVLRGEPASFLRQEILPEIMRARDLQRLAEEICDWMERL